MFKISYLTTNPIEGECPIVQIDDDNEYTINFYDKDKLLKSVTTCDRIVYGDRQWFTNWKIEIIKDNKIVYVDNFNLKNKVVFIKFDAYALGDNIAWIPYVEEFRKKHNCKIICSTFYNSLFENTYTDIMFVKPNIQISNVYAQYYIGVDKNKFNIKYSPVDYSTSNLQKSACDILGLEYKEIKPKFNKIDSVNQYGKYVCISEFSSNKIKNWNLKNGWQDLVNYFHIKGYKVVVISKEKTSLTGVIDKSGNFPLIDRIKDLQHAKLFVGVSSGLACLSWMVGTTVAIISDYTPPEHEFQSNIIRIYSNNCRKRIIKKELKTQIPLNIVLNKIDEFLG